MVGTPIIRVDFDGFRKIGDGLLDVDALVGDAAQIVKIGFEALKN